MTAETTETRIYTVRIQPMERNVAAATARVKATSEEHAIERTRIYQETRSANHIARLALGRRPVVSMKNITYTVVSVEDAA